MKIPIFDKDGKEMQKKDLPSQFAEDVRPDLIKRAVQAIDANTRQPYGAHPGAGMRASAEISRRRRKYRGSYGFGISRVPRKILSRRGTRFNWVGAVAPGTVGGRRAHPPKAEKVWSQKINKKERKMAIRSALSATLIKEMVEQRGHNVPDNYPMCLSEDFESLSKTKDVLKALINLGFAADLERTAERKIRAGKGKMRNRRYKSKKSLLLVFSEPCNASKAAKNIRGVDVVSVKRINTQLLAPGTTPGRMTVFTNKAIDVIEKEKLFE